MKTAPFANLNELGRRFATATENQQGFPCGPADQSLFNGMFFRLESELGHVIDWAGLVGTDTDLTQLRQAIQQMILSGLAGLEDTAGTIDTSQFILIGQARARLPIFPEILNGTGLMGVTSPAPGTVRVPAGVTFQHRGIFPIVTVQTDFATAASKTYHLRWNPTDGFTLNDLADVTYNPTVAPETSAIFDSAYDDMLVARVITNGSNIATITGLVNLANLDVSELILGTNKTGSASTVTWDVLHSFNWSRRPKSHALYPVKWDRDSGDTDYTVGTFGAAWGAIVANPVSWGLDRYQIKQTILFDNVTSNPPTWHFSGHA